MDNTCAAFLDNACWFWVLGVELGDLDLFRESDLAEYPDAVVVDVEFIPGKAVARADGMCVVVVVPAFAAGEQGNPPVVAGIVSRLKAATAPQVGRRIHQPGGMQ